MPIAGIRISPLSNVPVIAPRVLIAYSKLMPVPLACPGDETAALRSGSVMPIIAVGIARIAKELTSRATVSTPSESGRGLVERCVEHGRRIEEERRDQSGDADQNFRDAERGQRRHAPSKHAAREHAPDRQSRHERREHGAGRIDGDAKNQRQPAQPEDLVDETRDAGHVKQRKHRSPAQHQHLII